MSLVYGYDNTITSSGDYTIVPAVPVLGLISLGGGGATVSGSDVNANISFAPSLLGLADPYYVTATQGAHVTVDGLSNNLIGVLTGATITADGGTISMSGEDTISVLSCATYNIENGGTLMINQVEGESAIAALGASSVNFGTGGGTLIITPGSNVSILEFPSINGFDQPGATIEIPDATAIASVSQSGSDTDIVTTTGQTIQVQGDFYDYATQHNLFQSTSDGNLYISTTPMNSTGDNGVLVCFLAGSMIATPDGAIAVEKIKENDTVLALVNGQHVPRTVVWAGKAQASVRAGVADDEAGYPVRIRQNAISDGVPYKDMLITTEHCLFFNGRFIPARMLVNGRSVLYDYSITSYEYYHIELEEHAIIMADGMLTESYLDTGNRRAFQQAGQVIRIGGKIHDWSRDAAAPLGVSRDFVEPVFRQIEARAMAAGLESQSAAAMLSNDPDLYLMTDAHTIIPRIREANGKVFFMVPPDVHNVRIMSRTARPSDMIGPYVDDRRQLGVLIGNIRLFEGNITRTITSHLTDETSLDWHGGGNASNSVPCRWTNGRSVLKLGDRRPATMGLLCLEILAGGPYGIEDSADVNTDMSRLTA